jgi:hypothetical protein
MKLRERVVRWMNSNPELAIKLIYLGIYLVLGLLALLVFYVSPAHSQTPTNQVWCTSFNTGREDCIYPYWYNKDFPNQSASVACYPNTIPGTEYCEGIDLNCNSPENKDICKEFGLLK